MLISLLLCVVFAAPAFGQANQSQLNETKLLNIGLDLFDQNRYNESLAAFDKLIEIDPLNTVAWKMRGIDLAYMQKYDQAIFSFNQAAQLNSTDPEPWFNMGRVYDLVGDLGSAVQAYNRATQIKPDYQAAWFYKNQDLDIIGIGHTSLYNELTGGR
jgi:tetratricopeptide (TPR) repeat protein